jgi:purine-cytosine permease-like protein
MSFLALGIKLPRTLRQTIVAIVFGVAGFFLALSGLSDVGEKYNNFLLVIAYWIGPWQGVFFTDQFLRRRKRGGRLPVRPQAQPVGRVRRHGGCHRAVNLAVRQPDRLHRCRAQALPGVR